MRKRNMLFVGAGLLMIVAIGGVMYVGAQPATTPETYAAAKSTATTSKCLAENTALTIAASDRTSIETVAVSYLVDVPAGTNVDVKIATYSDDTVTGTDKYPAKYGNYNFVMHKQSGNWAITEFKHCG